MLCPDTSPETQEAKTVVFNKYSIYLNIWQCERSSIFRCKENNHLDTLYHFIPVCDHYFPTDIVSSYL